MGAPGTRLGDCNGVPVYASAGHDTASAVVAVPAKGSDWCYISSGTWSLMGVEVDEPVINQKSLELNFTNELGAGVPTANTGRANWAYISSGTWSLMGVEVNEAILTPRALELNVTNEGGIDGTYRLLKNIMGLWLVQRCKRAFDARGKTYDYAELVRLAEQAPPFRSLIDADDARFLAPSDMPAAIQDFCRETGQPVPASAGALVR